MHLLKINLNALGIHRYNKGLFLILYGLLLLAFLFKGQTTAGATGYIADGQQIGHWQTASHFTPAQINTQDHLFFDFEDVNELDSQSDTQNKETDKENARTGLPLLLLSSANHIRTQSTLAHCASSLQQRIVIPLFVLHHAWKHFPA